MDTRPNPERVAKLEKVFKFLVEFGLTFKLLHLYDNSSDLENVKVGGVTLLDPSMLEFSADVTRKKKVPFIDIGMEYQELGHFLVLSWAMEKKFFLYRMDGGSSEYDRLPRHKYFFTDYGKPRGFHLDLIRVENRFTEIEDAVPPEEVEDPSHYTAEEIMAMWPKVPTEDPYSSSVDI